MYRSRHFTWVGRRENSVIFSLLTTPAVLPRCSEHTRVTCPPAEVQQACLPAHPPAELRPARPSTSKTCIPGRPVCLHILGLSPGRREGPGSHVPQTPPPIYRLNPLEVVKVKSVVQTPRNSFGASLCRHLPAHPPAEPQPATPSTSGTHIPDRPARRHILGLSPDGRDGCSSHRPQTPATYI